MSETTSSPARPGRAAPAAPAAPEPVADGRSTHSQDWILRPTLWFIAASMATTFLHELAHACVAYLLGVRSTLFNDFVHLEAEGRPLAQRVLIGVAGPLFCLGLGLVAGLAFRRERGSEAGLPLIYLTVFGIGTFFGNLMSISFVGDFSNVATLLSLPMTGRYAITVLGALLVAGIHFWGGRELVRWVPSRVRVGSGVAGIIVLPAVLGTLAVILANQPMPRPTVGPRSAESAFWLFAAAGAWTARRDPQGGPRPLAVRWFDGMALLLALLVTRLTLRGIAFNP